MKSLLPQIIQAIQVPFSTPPDIDASPAQMTIKRYHALKANLGYPIPSPSLDIRMYLRQESNLFFPLCQGSKLKSYPWKWL